MDNLSLEKFNPKKSELIELSKKFQSLEIKGIDDVEGYKQVDEARKELKKQRVGVEKQGKEFRADALKFQKAVIAYEKELVEIIEPLEIELGKKQEVIDLEKHKIKMVALLPDRKARLLAIKHIEMPSDDEILEMDSVTFENAFIFHTTKSLEIEKAEIAFDKAKIEKENQIREAENRARLEAEEKAKREIELSKQKAELDKQEALRKTKLH